MKKIMFNDRYGLTKAVLEGRKTMTRRAVPEKLLEAYYDYDDYVCAVAPRDIPCTREYEEEFFLRRARFEVGEVVAVAQSYGVVYDEFEANVSLQEARPILEQSESEGWANKMFVRADLMPHQIRITNVRVERLQDISDNDCLREGIWKDNEGGRVIGFPIGIPFYYTFDGAVRDGKQLHWTTPKEAFSALIDKVSGKGTWASNPWVFVYEFELVK